MNQYRNDDRFAQPGELQWLEDSIHLIVTTTIGATVYLLTAAFTLLTGDDLR